jgi:DNA-binding GntR family transcriptional regulator
MARIRYANNMPVRLERNYYAEAYKDIIQENLEGSIRKLLFSKYDIIEPKQICSTVEIAYTSPEGGQLLGTKRNAPVLKVNGTLYNEMGKPIYMSEMLHLPDRCVLVLLYPSIGVLLCRNLLIQEEKELSWGRDMLRRFQSDGVKASRICN